VQSDILRFLSNVTALRGPESTTTFFAYSVQHRYPKGWDIAVAKQHHLLLSNPVFSTSFLPYLVGCSNLAHPISSLWAILGIQSYSEIYGSQE
jgi:hypothetical protein